MDSRERYIETLTFGTPDRIPFAPGGGRESTRKRWHSEGLPEGRNPNQFAMETLGIDPDPPTQPRVGLDADFRLRPIFEEKILEHKGGHYVVQAQRKRRH